MLCRRSMALNCKERKKFTHLQYDPILICLARNCSTGPKKKNRWTDTEEKVLVELFGENEDKLRYKAFSSPAWLSIARQLHSRCKEQNVDSDKTPQQCKNKLANLTKKYKNTKDKLVFGVNILHNESEESEDIIPKHFNDMDEILGKRESINPRPR